MKKCPNCKKTYGDELFFCLDDGSPLKSILSDADPDALTEAAFDIGSSLRTEVLPVSQPTPKTTIIQSPLSPKPSKLPYVIIALLIFICGGLAAVLIGTNLDRILPEKQTNVPKLMFRHRPRRSRQPLGTRISVQLHLQIQRLPQLQIWQSADGVETGALNPALCLILNFNYQGLRTTGSMERSVGR